MNSTKALLDESKYDLVYGKLALIALCVLFMTAAIDKQLAVQANGTPAVMAVGDLDLGMPKGEQTARERLRVKRRRLCQMAAYCSGPIYEADCVRCGEEGAAAARESQGTGFAETAGSSA
jgi:UrcA family protein